MLQMDGSTHLWFGNEKTTLIATIDDATSDIPGARFYPSETTWGCFKVLEDVSTNHGIPEVILPQIVQFQHLHHLVLVQDET